jgi:hypothetical protein
MSRLVRVWLALGVSYAVAKFAIDLGTGGSVSDPLASWLAIVPITAIQAAVMVALTRRRNSDPGEGA